MKNEFKDRALGCFMGLAVGDALGAPVEFKEPDEFAPVTDYRAGGAFNLPAGFWTDDTSMALALAETYLVDFNLSNDAVMANFYDWFKNGKFSSTGRCFDIGNQTRHALMSWKNDIQPSAAATTDFSNSGNGCIMRLAPVVLVNHRNSGDAAYDAVLQSKTTHPNALCTSYSQNMAMILVAAINGEDMQQWFVKSAATIKPKNTGYVVDTYNAAIWATGTSETFEEAVLKAVNLGGDADTIAAVTGQFAGARWGLSSIPDKWITNLHDNQMLLDVATRLYHLKER